MKVVENPLEALAHVDHWRREGRRIGLVPTMGALHAGHYSLVDRSRQECEINTVSIFVNPTQFGPHEDFSKYPRTLESDLDGLRARGVDLVFVPQPADLYPEGFSTYIDPPLIAESLEGDHRPGHFRGVATIVLKLFQCLPATIAYFGQKDFQQLAVIRRMVEDLNVPIRIEACPTLRENDGLAMSSRNRYLSPDERLAALALWKALATAQQMVAAGELRVAAIEHAMEATLYDQGADRIDYARVMDADSLQKIEKIESTAVALIAAYVGRTRLIDNLILATSQRANA